MLRDQIFSYPSTFILPLSPPLGGGQGEAIFDIGLLVKNIKNNLALMGNSLACTVNLFPFISVLIFGCFFPSFCGIFFIEKVNLL